MENTNKSDYMAPSMMVYEIKVEHSLLVDSPNAGGYETPSGRDYVDEETQNW